MSEAQAINAIIGQRIERQRMRQVNPIERSAGVKNDLRSGRGADFGRPNNKKRSLDDFSSQKGAPDGLNTPQTQCKNKNLIDILV